MVHDFIWNWNFVQLLDLLQILDPSVGEVPQILVVIVVESAVIALVREDDLK